MTNRIAALAIVGLLALAGVAAGAVVVSYDTGTEFQNAAQSATNVTYNNDTVNVTGSYQTGNVEVVNLTTVTVNVTGVSGNATVTVYNGTDAAVATRTINATGETAIPISDATNVSVQIATGATADWIEVDRLSFEDADTGGTGVTGGADPLGLGTLFGVGITWWIATIVLVTGGLVAVAEE